MDINSENLANHELNCSLKQDEVAVVIVPFPAQGHLNQLLQLASLISSYGLPFCLVSPATYNLQARVRANALNPSDVAKIHFHDLPTPDFSIPLPATTTFMSNIFMLLRDPIASLLRDISSKARRAVVIHDPLMSYNVQDVSSFPNAETYIFKGFPSFGECCNKCIEAGLPLPLEDELLQRLPSDEGFCPDEILNVVSFKYQHMGIRAGDIYNTSKVIEGTTFLGLVTQLASTVNKKLWAIGPILPTKLADHISYNIKNHCLDWLNKQPPRSVLYVSFGTTSSFSDEQIKELAMGLELSKQRFIWVLRDADKEDIFTGEARRFELPEGFEERLKGIGLVVREWAPQPEIMAHSSRRFHELPWLEFLLREHYYGGCNSCLAYAL